MTITHARLGTTAARGGAITVAGQLARILVQVAGIAVLARLLSPRDYGLVAAVTALVGVGEIFRDFGLSAATVQAPSLSRTERDLLFWANGALGMALTTVAVACSGLIARAYAQPELQPVAAAVGVTFVLNGLATQHRAHLQRDLRFGALAVADVVAQVVGLAAGIAMALAGAGYWALVGQQVAQAAAALAYVVVTGGWLPGLPRDARRLRPFLRFGGTFVAAQLVGYAAKNVDSVTIAHRFGFTPLGVYNRAYQILMGPLARVRAPTTTVAVPVLARLQDDEDRFSRYVQSGQIALGYTFVSGIALAAGAAEPLVRLVLGDRWLSVVPLFTVLALAAAFETLPYVAFWVYVSRGLTGPLLRYDLVSSAMKIALIVAGSQWGVLGVAAGYAAGSALNWPLALWRLSRVTSVPLAGLVGGAARILGTAITAGAVTWLTSTALASHPLLVRLVLALAAGVAVYAAAAVAVPAVRRDELMLVDIVRRTVTR